MPQNEAAAIDPLAGGPFSRLLFSDVELEDPITLDHHHPTGVGATRHFTFSADQKPPKMLCFGGGDYQNSATTDDNNNSSSPSSTTSLSSNSNMKRNMRCDNYFQPVVLPGGFTTTTTTTTTAPMTTAARRNYKKSRAENTPPPSHAKVKKEKLGERIAALQQMVSPYGKTDTASVLHEALGYIKFLQEQVQVLCSPYLQRPPSARMEQEDGEEGKGKGKKDLLGRRGLCLVPVECTLHVAESNGADLWSPAMVVNPSPLHLDLPQ